MSARVRRRKIKWFHKLATPMYEMERPESSMSGPERMQQSFEYGQNPGNRIPICSWNDSIILDVFGLVPIAGDALDLGRSFVYMNCGKHLDALIGLATAAPVIGAGATGIKWIKKLSGYKKTKDFLFGMADTLKSSGLYRDIGDAIFAIKKYIKEAFLTLKAFYYGILNKKTVFFEDAVKLDDSMKKFEIYLNDALNIDKESFNRWKLGSMEKSQYVKKKDFEFDFSKAENFAKRYSNFLADLVYSFEFWLNELNRGRKYISEKISNGMKPIIFKDLEDLKSASLDQIKKIDNIEDLNSFMKRFNRDMSSDITGFFGCRKGTDLKKCKELSVKNIEYAIKQEKINLEKQVYGISSISAKYISERYNLFLTHITSESYTRLIKKYINKHTGSTASDKEVSDLINSFFKDYKPVKIKVVNQDEIKGAVAVSVGNKNLIKSLKSAVLSSSTLIHELMHNFDRNFAIFLNKKYRISGKNNLSDVVGSRASSEALSNSASVVNNFKEQIDFDVTKMISSKTKKPYKDIEEYINRQINYYSRPTEVQSHFNDLRTHMIDEGVSSKYPTLPEILKYLESSEGHKKRGLYTFYKSIKNAAKEMGDSAYTEFKVEKVTGNFVEDYFLQFGL